MFGFSLRNHSAKRFFSLFKSTFLELPYPCIIPSPAAAISHLCPPISQTRHFLALICCSYPLHLSNHVRRYEISASASSTPTPTDSASHSRFLSVRILCSRDVADMLSEALICFGASSASMDDVDSCESTDEIFISSIFTEGQDVGRCISHAADSIGLNKMPSYEVVMDKECDWIKNTLALFQPVEVTDNLWIIPEWKTPPDVQATNIILNPGMAFGTGEHPTTKLCLLLLHHWIKGGEYFLDYGTGSGILGIAALKLGAALYVGFDVDPNAITSAHQNAALNNIQPEKMQLYLTSGKIRPLSPNVRTSGAAEESNSYGFESMCEKKKFDIVIANILLNPLIELADDIISYAKPGAIIGISGILSEQITQIEKCYSQHLDSMSVSEMDGWACISGIKKQ